MPFAIYIILAGFYLVTVQRGRRGHYLLKAAPIVLLALLAADRPLLVLALLFSAAGDVALGIDSQRYFAPGLFFFLVAHLLYSALFAANLHVRPATLAATVPIVAVALLYLRRLLPHLGKLRLPVFLYVLAIVVMSCLSLLHQPFSWLLVGGALLFMFSDATIAWHKFVGPVPQRDLIVMSSYYLAQLLLLLGFLSV